MGTLSEGVFCGRRAHGIENETEGEQFDMHTLGNVAGQGKARNVHVCGKSSEEAANMPCMHLLGPISTGGVNEKAEKDNCCSDHTVLALACIEEEEEEEEEEEVIDDLITVW